ncbi:hypothetical protein J6590_074198 [Homalodisca vitripennis]|nr:hypothetical protein J6590_074198 [Homalodisca vitripennis]
MANALYSINSNVSWFHGWGCGDPHSKFRSNPTNHGSVTLGIPHPQGPLSPQGSLTPRNPSPTMIHTPTGIPHSPGITHPPGISNGCMFLQEAIPCLSYFPSPLSRKHFSSEKRFPPPRSSERWQSNHTANLLSGNYIVM